jgi:hypothetical protein
VAIGLLVAGSLAACSSDATQDGTNADVKGAAQAMQELNSYTFEGDVVAAAVKFHIAGAFNAPNRVSETVTPEGGAATKIVVIGDKSYQLKPGSSNWTAAGGLAADPRRAFTAVAHSDSMSSAADQYSFRISGQAAASLVQGSTRVTGAARVQAGRIVGLSYRSDTPAISVDLTYAAFNTAPPVTPPPT